MLLLLLCEGQQVEVAVMGRIKALLTVFPLFNDLFEHTHTLLEEHSWLCFHTVTHTCVRTRALGMVPHGGQDDLVQQVLVQLLGHRQAGPLHGHRRGQTQDDAEAAEHAEHRQVPGVTEAAVLQPRGSRITPIPNDGHNTFTQPDIYLLERTVCNPIQQPGHQNRQQLVLLVFRHILIY